MTRSSKHRTPSHLIEGFGAWWDRQEAAGFGVADPYEVGVLKAVAEAAYKAGARKQRLLNKLIG